jgi:hypothetical protein
MKYIHYLLYFVCTTFSPPFPLSLTSRRKTTTEPIKAEPLTHCHAEKKSSLKENGEDAGTAPTTSKKNIERITRSTVKKKST